MKIIVDSREQHPFDFSRFRVEIERSALPTGDYSLPGFEDRVAIERKGSLDELVMCLSSERARFERELQRSTALQYFAVVVEGSFMDVAAGRFRSRMSVNAVVETVAAFSVRYKTSFLFCGGRLQAERMTYSLLSKFERERHRTQAA